MKTAYAMRIGTFYVGYNKHEQQFTIGTRFDCKLKWMWIWMWMQIIAIDQLEKCKYQDQIPYSSEPISVFTPFHQFSIKMDLLKQLQIFEFKEQNANGIGFFFTSHITHLYNIVYMYITLFQIFSLPFHAQLAFTPQHIYGLHSIKRIFFRSKRMKWEEKKNEKWEKGFFTFCLCMCEK